MITVFFIPSWYPSKSNPFSGIFFKEQASYISELYPKVNIGISLWGQNDSDYMISKNIFRSLQTILGYCKGNFLKTVNHIRPNLIEYSSPTINWTSKIFNGNFSAIIEANHKNFDSFQNQYGKVHLIHAHVSYPAGFIAMEIAKRQNIPYIITEHMGPFPFNNFLLANGNLDQKVADPIRNASKLTAVSPKLSDDIKSFNLQDAFYIPNVIDEDFFFVGDKVVSTPFKFFTLANISHEKGFDDLLQAIKKVVIKNSNVKFSIGGGGKHRKYYESLSAKLGIDKYITWLGALSRSEAREQYQKCNAFILPSHIETFGIVYAEAIACGKPIIATRCGGPECIVNSKNGVLANVKDPQNLVEKIEFIIENYEIYNCKEIRKDFEERFSKKAVVPQIVELYKSLI